MFKSHVVLTFAILFLCTGSIIAAAPGRDLSKEKILWDELSAMSPEAVEKFKLATSKMDQGNAPEAAPLFQEVIKLAPEFAAGYRRLGYVYNEIGNQQEAIAMLEIAVQKEPSATNQSSLAEVLAFPHSGKATAENKVRALSLAQQAAPSDTDETSLGIIAQITLEQKKDIEFKEALSQLNRKFPDALQTHYFNAVAAANDGNWVTAENEIRMAEKSGLDAKGAEEFLASGIGWRAKLWRTVYWGMGLTGLWAVGLIALFAGGKILSMQTLKQIKNANPNQPISASEISLRKFYKQLIHAASLYYYASLPVVIFLVLAFAGGILYFFMWMGRLPIKLVAVLVIGALITVFYTIKSIFIKINNEDPGRPLTQNEAPGLWQLTREVAQKVGTRPIDEIRVLPGTDLAVYENGSAAQIKNNQGKRIFLLGIGTLNGFSQNAFRAVLAHEYGHFSHRDTAGGDVALKVNASMIKMANTMIETEQNTPWNIAFQFVRLYYFIFHRISFGATRLQEVLADRVAARCYGAEAFTQGLSHAIRRTIEFNFIAGNEIEAAATARRSLVNLYYLQIPAEKAADAYQQIEEQFKESINRPTTEEDSHPAPCERFELVQKVRCTSQLPVDALVWDLFKDPVAITDEMSHEIERRVFSS